MAVEQKLNSPSIKAPTVCSPPPMIGYGYSHITESYSSADVFNSMQVSAAMHSMSYNANSHLGDTGRHKAPVILYPLSRPNCL